MAIQQSDWWLLALMASLASTALGSQAGQGGGSKEQGKPEQQERQEAPEPAAEPVIRRGDNVRVTMYDLQGPGHEMVLDLRVGRDGRIRLPQIPRVRAAGRTAAELERAVAAAYQKAGLIDHLELRIEVAKPADAKKT